MSAFDEIRRRNVHRVALAYVAGAWLIIQVAETLLPVFGFSDGALRVAVIALAIGFVPALVVAWHFEWTSGGIVRESDAPGRPRLASSKPFDRAITFVLLVAVAYFAADKFILSAPDTGGDRSIAVMPLANISDDSSQDFFASGLSIELTNLLSSIPELRVISSNTMGTFSNQEVSISEAAEKANVRHVLTGAVRRAGDRLRVSVQLVDAQKESQLWSEVYERTIDDVFAIQDDIAARVVGQMRLQLSDEAPTTEQIDSHAYELYLEGHHLTHTIRTPAAFAEAEKLLEASVEIEPAYIPAIWSLARAISNQADSRDPVADKARLDRIEVLVDRMVELAPDSSYANGWLAFYANQDGDRQAAATYTERALAGGTDANLYLVQAFAVRTFVKLGRLDEAIALARYVVKRDPACTICVYQLAYAMRAAGNHREAAEELEKLLDWVTPSADIAWSLGVTWLVAGDPEAALGYFEQAIPGSGELGRILALYDLNRLEEYESYFAELIANPRESPESIARIAAWTGKSDIAFEYLDRFIEIEGRHRATEVKTDLYEPIKHDPRWKEFLERNGATDDQTASFDFDPELPDEVVAAIEELRRNQ